MDIRAVNTISEKEKELDKIMTMFSADDIDRCQSCAVRDECIWDITRKI